MTNESKLIISALDKIYDSKQLCLEQEFELLLIDILILEGLLLSMNDKQKQSKKVLEEAISISKELGLKEKEQEAQNQLKGIEKEKKNLLVRIFTRINQSIRSSISYESVTQPKTIDVDIRAIYIIAHKTGLPIYQKEFHETQKIDSNLLSGLLSAIRTMGQTILDAKEGGLKLIDHGDVAIMLETGESSLFALVVSQETYLIREQLREFMREFEKEKIYKSVNESIIIMDEKTEEKITDIVSKYFK